MTKPNDPAFPEPLENCVSGLTIREYFAAMALQACAKPGGSYSFSLWARDAVDLADRLIEELNKDDK